MEGMTASMLFIFFARICDVSIGTIRIILVARGYRLLAPVFGFVEILIWLTAIGTALKNMDTMVSFLVYAAGFAAGNYVGMMLESWIAIGYQSVRIITTRNVTALPLTLREEGFGITSVVGQGMKGDVLILYTVIRKRDMKTLLEIVKELEPKSFITIEDVRSFYYGFIGRRGFNTIAGRLAVKQK